jgi:hypothetical protein
VPFVESISIPIVLYIFPIAERRDLKLSGSQSPVLLTYSIIYSAFSLFYIFTIPPRNSAFHHLIKVADISTIWADRTYPLEGKKEKLAVIYDVWFGDS